MFGQMRSRSYRNSNANNSDSNNPADKSLHILISIILLLCGGLILLEVNTKSTEQIRLKAKIRELTTREEGVPVPHYTVYYATIEAQDNQVYVARSAIPFSQEVGKSVTITVHDQLVFGKKEQTVVDKVENND